MLGRPQVDIRMTGWLVGLRPGAHHQLRGVRALCETGHLGNECHDAGAAVQADAAGRDPADEATQGGATTDQSL
jgi:hypothetical protein